MPRNPMPQSSLGLNKIGRPRIEMYPLGNWEEVIRKVQRMGPEIKAASLKAQMKVAREIVKKVKAHIRNQDLGWRPLSPVTSALKSAYGLDERILWAHGSYYNAIEAWQKGTQHMVFAGVKKGKFGMSYSGRKRKFDIGQIAAIHEFSRGKRIPRRPLWNPTLKEIGQKGMRAMYTASLIANLRLRGIPITPFRNIL